MSPCSGKAAWHSGQEHVTVPGSQLGSATGARGLGWLLGCLTFLPCLHLYRERGECLSRRQLGVLFELYVSFCEDDMRCMWKGFRIEPGTLKALWKFLLLYHHEPSQALKPNDLF